MKSKFLSCLTFLLLIICAGTRANAICLTAAGCDKLLLDKINSLKAGQPEESAKGFCKKGALLEGQLSLRSGDGLGCRYSDTWAALAHLLCRAVDKKYNLQPPDAYAGSACEQYATPKYRGRSDEMVADFLKRKLKEKQKNLTDAGKFALCALLEVAGAAAGIPGLSSFCFIFQKIEINPKILKGPRT